MACRVWRPGTSRTDPLRDLRRTHFRMLTSRSGSAGHTASPPPQSIEAVRRRARHRLIGAAVLVLVGVLGFPLLFDTQPRPIAVDVPIEIPSRNTPATPVPKAEAAAPAAAKPAPVATADSLAAREEVVEPKVAAKPADRPVEKPADKPQVEKPSTDKAVVEKTTEKPAEKPSDKAATGNERIVVQVGAFSDAERAREARLKLERAGLKTYTHVAETPQGRRIRVRLGPFATRAEAEKAAERAKALGLSTALLWL
jgi:DedD protein